MQCGGSATLTSHPAVILLFNGDEPIVPFLFFLITPLSLNNADHATLQYAPGKGRFIHQNQNVEWISVSTFRRGQKSEVVRKSHSRRQYLLQFELTAEFVSKVTDLFNGCHCRERCR